MIQEIYQKALHFAGEQHHAQQVPGSKANYVVHLSNVTMEVLLAHSMDACFDLDKAVQLAILHDVVEDTDTTLEEVQQEFGLEVAKGVAALTKNVDLGSKSVQMQDSLKRILLESKEVGLVKMADRITNLQAPPHYWPKEKMQRYALEAQTIQTTLGHCNAYLSQRLQERIHNYAQYYQSSKE